MWIFQGNQPSTSQLVLSSRSMAASNEAVWLPTGPKSERFYPISVGQNSSIQCLPFHFNLPWLHVTVLHQDVYTNISGGLLGSSIWTVGSNDKGWFLIYPSMLVVVLQSQSFQFVMCFFHWVISGRFVNGTQNGWWKRPRGPWPSMRPVVIGGRLRWCHQRCRKGIQVGHSCEFVEHVSRHSQMRVVGTIGASLQRRTTWISTVWGERLL